jgi:hypothetical protein
MIAHVMDVGANYWSLLNFHEISASRLASYYQAYRASFDRINRRIGYRVRPSFIWRYEDDGYVGLIVGFANDGTAGVPGVLRVTVESQEGQSAQERLSGCRLSGAGKDPAGTVCAAQGNKMARSEAEGGDRGERNALSGALGVQPAAQ